MLSREWETFKAMVKEEWRVHSTMFGGVNFILFPILLIAIAFLGTTALPMVGPILPNESMAVIAHYMFLLFGLSVGSFGLLAREALNRRFGQASMIAYSSRTLPLSERSIFTQFFLKDVAYYLMLWIFPLVFGFGAGLALIGSDVVLAFALLLTGSLSFMIGLGISFFLSTIYVHSAKALAMLGGLLSVILVFANFYVGLDIVEMLPPLSFFLIPSIDKILVSVAFIVFTTTFSVFFMKADFQDQKTHFKESLDAVAKGVWFAPIPYRLIVAKDFLDLQRSEGGIGKIIFSLMFPLAVVWLLLSVFLRIMPLANPMIVFAIFLSALSSSIYNWLTEYDLFGSYSFVPIRVSTVIKGKAISYALLNSISIIILILVAFGGGVEHGEISYFPAAIVTFLSLSVYVLSVNVFLTGLHPNVLIYDARKFLAYITLVSPLLVFMIFVSMVDGMLLFGSVILAIPAALLLRAGLKKWDTFEPPSY
jgi:hypothetical protein